VLHNSCGKRWPKSPRGDRRLLRACALRLAPAPSANAMAIPISVIIGPRMDWVGVVRTRRAARFRGWKLCLPASS